MQRDEFTMILTLIILTTIITTVIVGLPALPVESYKFSPVRSSVRPFVRSLVTNFSQDWLISYF